METAGSTLQIALRMAPAIPPGLLRTDKQPGGAVAAIPVRHVDHHRIGLGERDGARVADDADHREWRLIRDAGPVEFLANGILAGPESVCAVSSETTA